MKYEFKKRKYILAQGMIDIRIVKAFNTSNENLCTVADTTPIMLKIEVALRIYNLT
jgi:hypothetical protein